MTIPVRPPASLLALAVLTAALTGCSKGSDASSGAAKTPPVVEGGQGAMAHMPADMRAKIPAGTPGG